MSEATNDNLISGATGDWEVVLGLEVHAQVLSQSHHLCPGLRRHQLLLPWLGFGNSPAALLGR